MEELKANENRQKAEVFGLDSGNESHGSQGSPSPFDQVDEPKNRKSAPEKLQHDEEEEDISLEKEKIKIDPRKSVLSMRRSRSILMHYEDKDPEAKEGEEGKVSLIPKMHGTSLWLFSK